MDPMASMPEPQIHADGWRAIPSIVTSDNVVFNLLEQHVSFTQRGDKLSSTRDDRRVLSSTIARLTTHSHPTTTPNAFTVPEQPCRPSFTRTPPPHRTLSLHSDDVFGRTMSVVGRAMHIVRTLPGCTWPVDAIVVAGSATASVISGRTDANDIDILMTGLEREAALEYVRQFKRILARSGQVLSVERRLSTVDILFSPITDAQMKIQLIWDGQHDSRLAAIADYDVSVGRAMAFPITATRWCVQLSPDVLENILSRQLVYQWYVHPTMMYTARARVTPTAVVCN